MRKELIRNNVQLIALRINFFKLASAGDTRFIIYLLGIQRHLICAIMEISFLTTKEIRIYWSTELKAFPRGTFVTNCHY